MCLYGHVNKARSCCKVGSAVTDKVKTFTATGLGLIVISIVIGFGTIVIAKIKHANSERNYQKMKFLKCQLF